MYFSVDFLKFLYVVLYKLLLFNLVYRNICVGIELIEIK